MIGPQTPECQGTADGWPSMAIRDAFGAQSFESLLSASNRFKSIAVVVSMRLKDRFGNAFGRRPSAVSKVRDYVSAQEVHRHHGVEIHALPLVIHAGWLGIWAKGSQSPGALHLPPVISRK